MKKYVLILLITCTASAALSGQHLLVKGGLNFTNVSSEKDINLSTSSGFHAGIGLEIPLVGLYHIGTGMYYTRRGYKSNEPGMEGKVFIDYLDIPVDFMLKFKPGDLVGAYVSVGPYFSYGISSQVFDVNGLLQNGFDLDEIDLKRIDTGINIGMGIDVSKFRLSAAYGFSLTDNGSIKDNVLKNRVIKISIGYMFF